MIAWQDMDIEPICERVETYRRLRLPRGVEV